MPPDGPEFQSVGVVGGGLIGMSWAALFLAHGCDVTVVDPDETCAARLEAYLPAAWNNLTALGWATQPTPRLPRVTQDVAALAGVGFVQENGPERLDVKRAILRDLEAVLAPDAPIASSTSSFMASDLQDGARHPERILVAHPMNPPHLVPMVELVAGRDTAPKVLDTAERFYTQMRRVPIRVRREVPGHLANRLTSALYREAVHLVAEGIASVEDIDKAVAYGPGLRWALMGPHLTYHLGGGAAGYRGYLDHLGPTQQARWKSLGAPELTDRLKDDLVAGMARALEAQDQATLVQRRDDALEALLKLKAAFDL